MLATRRRTLTLLLVASLGQVLLISVQVQSKRGLPLAQEVPFAVFARIERAFGALAGGLSGLWSHYIALSGASRESEALKRQVAELEGQLQAERAVADSTRALEDVLGLRKTLSVQTLAARVIAFDPSPDALTLTVDRGTADGVGADMAVLASQGVVGKVLRATPHAAQVQLLTGRSAGVGATLERTSAEGVVKGGAGDPPLEMWYVSNAKDVKAGDRVVTSGHDGVYAEGFPIGVVERAERGSGLYRAIRIRPFTDFSHLSVVLVVMDRPAKPERVDEPAHTPLPAGRGKGRGGV